ncbi:outer membrane beta-barrel protein [Fulvimarina sp. MAC8]|uniref:outer membrane beta-barrel protein n=1 Tax=Fulvimarina sp. MAC8 TaxID=3162874 RepID=UPI0032ED69D8
MRDLRQVPSAPRDRFEREGVNETSDRDREPLGQRSSLFMKNNEALTTSERELLRELYQEGATVDRLDDEEYGRPEPEEAKEPESQDFDIFAGREESSDTLDPYEADAPAAPAGAVAPEKRRDEDDESSLTTEEDETSDAFSPLRSAVEPARPVSEEQDDPELGNQPLAAGVAGETLSSNSLLGENNRARAIERILRPKLDDKPFAPVGLRAGTLTIYPELYQGVGVTTNIDEKAGGGSGAFSETELRIRAETDWSRHEGELNGRLTYRRDFGGEEDPNNPEAALDGRLRLEFGALTNGTLRGAIAYRRDDEVDLGADLASGTPEILSGSIGAELSHEIARTTLTGGVTVAREHYITTVPGIPDPSYTTATATARAAYGLSPAIQPFVETSVGRRMFDEKGLINADATIPALRTGLQLDLAEKVRGEVAAGYAWSMPEEGETTSAPTVDATLTWSPRRGTDLVLEARTIFEPKDSGTSTANYEASLGLLHALNAQLDLNATLTAELETSEGPQKDPLGLAAEVGFTYWLNRTLALSGGYEYEKRFEPDPSEDWAANTVTIGLRLQR